MCKYRNEDKCEFMNTMCINVYNPGHDEKICEHNAELTEKVMEDVQKQPKRNVRQI